MPVNIYRRERYQDPNEETIANAILAGTQGFVQGRQIKRQGQEDTLANAYRKAQIEELQRKSQAHVGGTPSGFVQDPVSGRLLKDPNFYNEDLTKRKAATKAQAEMEAVRGLMGQFQPQLGGQGGATQFPPGTTLKAGPLTIPVNPKLTESEQSVIGAQETYPQEIETVKELVKKGTLSGKKGLLGSGLFPNVDRTVRQGAAQSKDPLLTYYDRDLQRLQSKLAKTKELMFERGGKALTPTEEGIVGQAFILKGKSDEQILEDIEAADQIIESKARLALGGAAAAQQGSLTPNLGSNDLSALSDEELRQMAGL